MDVRPGQPSPRKTDEHWNEAWRIYDAVCQLAPEARAAWLQSANPNQAVGRIVSDLLASREEEDEAAEERPEWPQLGRRIGRFEVREPLGRGGMGEVYLARDTELNRNVALKFMAAADLGSAGQIKRFIREAQAASVLNHPGIVTVYEVVRAGDSLAIAMELVEGAPFRNFCSAPNPPDRVAEWGRRIAQASAAAHAQGLVHRDIKPENLMLRGDGFIKILDFGLARNIADTHSTRTLSAGTLQYMSPEQIRGMAPTTASDIFSLGMVLYELIAGVHPFAAESAILTANRIVEDKPAPPSRHNAAVPPALDALILRMLDKDPAARPSAQTVADSIAAAEPPARVRVTRWRRSVAAASGIAAALVVLAGAGMFLQRAKSPAGPVPTLPLSPLTDTPGDEGQPAFSPDGERVAYTWDRGQHVNRVICVQTIAGGARLQLTDSAADDYNPVWSPDGSGIAFLRRADRDVKVMIAAVDVTARTGLREVGSIGPAQSGTHKLLAWSPDGNELVVSDEPRLYRLSLATARKTAITAPLAEESDVAPAFSPDGRRLAFLRVSRGAAYQLWTIDAASRRDGDARQLVASPEPIHAFSWTPDGLRLVYGSGPSIPINLWQVPAAGGAPRRAPFALVSPARQLTIAPKGNRLAYVHPLEDSNIWRLEGGRSRKWIGTAHEDFDPRYSPDGSQIAFVSSRTRYSEIWLADRDGSNQRQLTFQRSVSGSPAWSPNGRLIAFDSTAGGAAAVWIVTAAGGQPHRLVDESDNSINPTWSRDGAWVYFCSGRTGRAEIWKVRLAGPGAPGRVTRNGGYEAYESPDGRFLYYTKDPNLAGMWRMPLKAGPEELVPGFEKFHGRYWEVGRDGLYFAIAQPEPAVELLEFSTGRFRTLAHPALAPAEEPHPFQQPVRGLTVDPDARSFLYAQYDAERVEIVLADTGIVKDWLTAGK